MPNKYIMLHVGITGGIGAGKTTVCKLFEVLGIPIYYADDRAKWLMENQQELISGIVQLFGTEAYDAQKHLNRSYIAQKAFHNPELLQQLNALVHPAVALDGMEWQQAQSEIPYTLKEAALLFESGSYKLLDKIIVVSAPLELRIQRVMERDGSTREAVLQRISRQIPQEEKEARADFIIRNDGISPLIPQVLSIHQKLCGK